MDELKRYEAMLDLLVKQHRAEHMGVYIALPHDQSRNEGYWNRRSNAIDVPALKDDRPPTACPAPGCNQTFTPGFFSTVVDHLIMDHKWDFSQIREYRDSVEAV